MYMLLSQYISTVTVDDISFIIKHINYDIIYNVDMTNMIWVLMSLVHDSVQYLFT